MTGLDWVIIGIVAVSIVLAVEQGFFFELFALAGVVVGYVVAAWEYPRLAPKFQPYVKAVPIAELAAFLTIFLLVLLVAGLAGRITRWAMKEAGLRWFDRVLGGVFGLVRGVGIVAVIVLGLATFAPESRIVSESRLGGYFLVVARGASWVAPSELRARLRQGIDVMRQAEAPAAAGQK